MTGPEKTHCRTSKLGEYQTSILLCIYHGVVVKPFSGPTRSQWFGGSSASGRSTWTQCLPPQQHIRTSEASRAETGGPRETLRLLLHNHQHFPKTRHVSTRTFWFFFLFVTIKEQCEQQLDTTQALPNLSRNGACLPATERARF